MHPAGISARLAAFLLRPLTPSRFPETSSDDFAFCSAFFPLPLLTAFPLPHFRASASPLNTRAFRFRFPLLCPPCFLRSRALPRISARSSLALCSFPFLVFPGFPGSHFLFPSAFASVRTSSARLAFYFLAFLLPMCFRPPSGTSSPPLSLPASHPFAFRPSFFRPGSLSTLLRSRLHRRMISFPFRFLPVLGGTFWLSLFSNVSPFYFPVSGFFSCLFPTFFKVFVAWFPIARDALYIALSHLSIAFLRNFSKI